MRTLACNGLAILILVIGSLGTGAVSAFDMKNPLTPSSLLNALKSETTRTLPYKESRQLPEMMRPIQTSGQLEFRPPDYLAKHVQKPNRADYIIQTGRLKIQEDPSGEVIEMEVASIPPLQMLSETLQAVFSGDPSRVEALWTLHLGGSWNRWKLVLTPHEAHGTIAIREIQIEGQNTHLTRMILKEAEGALDTLEFSR